MISLMNICIIGAGPVGCYTGYLLSKKGHAVEIYENHQQVGQPIQCTGILTSDFDQFNLSVEPFLVNTITQIEVYSPNRKININQKDYIICRERFDNHLADMARTAGARIFLNHAFIRKEGPDIIIKQMANKNQSRSEMTITPDIVVAADGPLSPTAKAYGFYHPGRKNYFGIQATVESSFLPSTIKTFFGEGVCPGLFAWIVPESSTRARVGLAARENTRHYFDKFMKEFNFRISEVQAGTIPLFHPKQELQKDNCFLVGDASGYVKATTLGGIVPSLRQAEILADCIDNGKPYKLELRPLRRKMQTHLRLHKTFSRFSDADWDRLLMYVDNPMVSRVFEEHTRENPLPIVLKSLFRQPRFLYFLKYLL